MVLAYCNMKAPTTLADCYHMKITKASARLSETEARVPRNSTRYAPLNTRQHQFIY